jgi:hypothetical protein
MQWEAFFERFTNILIDLLARLPVPKCGIGKFHPERSPETGLIATLGRSRSIASDRDFREDIHTADLGGNPKF